MMKKLPLLLAYVLFGCSPAARTQMYNHATYPATTSVKVYLEMDTLGHAFNGVDTLKEPYKEIGYVSAEGGSLSGQEGFINSMKEEAMAAGADALIKVTFGGVIHDDRSVGIPGSYPGSGRYNNKTSGAIMVRYKSH